MCDCVKKKKYTKYISLYNKLIRKTCWINWTRFWVKTKPFWSWFWSKWFKLYIKSISYPCAIVFWKTVQQMTIDNIWNVSMLFVADIFSEIVDARVTFFHCVFCRRIFHYLLILQPRDWSIKEMENFFL